MPREDVNFSFNDSPFVKGIQNVAKGFKSLGDMSRNVTKGISKGVNSAILKIGALAGAFQFIKSAINEIPEIGQTFEIAKDIFMRNFLWPIRKTLMPLLQNILNWVRDNRARFVKWGQTVVTIFKTAVNIVGKFWNIIKTIGDSIRLSLEKVFGSFGNTIEETINILLFKITALAEFASVLLEPILAYLTPIIEKVAEVLFGVGEFLLKIGGSFFEGLFSGLEGAFPIFENILTIIGDIVDLLFTGEEATKFWTEAFKTLGEIVGGAVKFALEGIEFVLGGIQDAIEFITGQGKYAGKELTREDVVTIVEGLRGGRTVEELAAETGATIGQVERIQWDASIIQNVENLVTLHATEGDAEEVGRKFGEGTARGLADHLNSILNQEREKEGF